jgi:hypothetical protein
VPAQAFGVADQIGSIEPGKRADLVLWEGDPLDVAHYAEQVWLGGRAMPMRSRQTELRDTCCATRSPDRIEGHHHGHPALVFRLRFAVLLPALAEAEAAARVPADPAGADRLGAVLHLGNLGPAEIPAKRRFIYRQLLWTAQAEGTPLRFPPGHPFNPLSALRLCLAAGGSAQAVDVLFDWIWRDGNAADSAEALREPARGWGSRMSPAPSRPRRSRSSCGATPRPPLPACSACRPWPSMANCSGATTPTR